MRWIETINVRSGVGTDPAEMERVFRVLKSHVTGEEDVEMVIYRERFLDSDWAIHLQWETEDQPAGRTGLGMKVADMLRPLALLDHSIWIACDWQEPEG